VPRPGRGDTRAAGEILGCRNDLIAVADNEPILAASGGYIVAESVVATRRGRVLHGRVAVRQCRRWPGYVKRGFGRSRSRPPAARPGWSSRRRDQGLDTIAR
jgi:hypothetical protein